MGSSQVQTPVNKNSEFVDRATQIIDLIYAHLDQQPNCLHCRELLNKSGLGNPTPNPADADINNPEDQSGVAYTSG